jgi:hypothetical protein
LAQRDLAVRLAAEAEAEAVRLEAEERARKTDLEFAKRARAAFGKACKLQEMDQLHTDVLRANLSLQQLQEITDAFSSNDLARIESGKQIFTTHMSPHLTKQREMEEARALQKQQQQQQASAKDWSAEDDALLAQAVKQFPAETELRWHKVSEVEYATRAMAVLIPSLSAPLILILSVLYCTLSLLPHSRSRSISTLFRIVPHAI